MVPAASTAIFGPGVFEGDGAPNIRYYAPFDLPQLILTVFGGTTIHLRKVMDSPSFTILVIPHTFSPLQLLPEARVKLGI